MKSSVELLVVFVAVVVVDVLVGFVFFFSFFFHPDMCQFPSLDSCQKRFLWIHKEVDVAPHPVAGLVLQVRDTEKFPRALAWVRGNTGETCTT